MRRLRYAGFIGALAVGCGGGQVATATGTGTVAGFVCFGPYGSASAAAPVSARGPPGATVSGVTGDNGAFSLTGVEAGGGVVVVRSNRVEQKVDRVTLAAGATVTVGSACTVAGAQLTVHVCVAGSLTPRSGAALTLTYLDYGGADPAPHTGATDTQGDIVVPDLVPGRYVVEVAGAREVVTLTPGADTLWTDPDCYDPATVGRVSGRVCNPLSGDPVANVPVELDVTGEPARRTTQSDSDGRYEFTAVPPGSYTLTIKPPLQPATDLSVDVTAGATTQVPSYCTPDPVGSIAGFVCDAVSGAPAAGVDVQLLLTGEPARLTTTNSGGRYRFADVPPGTHTVTYAIPNGGAASISALVVENQELTLNAAECNATSFASVAGRVCNPADESPVPGVSVELAVTGEATPRTTSTDDQGNFRFDMVPPGSHQLTVYPPGQAPVSQSVTVAAGEQKVIPSPQCGAGTLPNPATLTGIACVGTTAPHPLAGATVTIDFSPGLKTTMSGLDGTWTVGNLAAGPVTVTVTRGSWTASTPATLVADQTTDLGMSPCVGSGTHAAIVSGVWDDLTGAFTDLGLPMRNDGTTIVDPNGVFDVIDGSNNDWIDVFGASVTNLNAYDMIIFESGVWLDRLKEAYCCAPPPITSDPCIFPPNPPDPTPPPRDCTTLPAAIALDNIQTYLEGGGKVVATDWAYDIARMQLLGYIDFYSNDTIALRAACGHAHQTALPIVLDEDLALLLGRANATIEYESGFNKWIALDPVAAQTNPYLVTFLTANVYVYDFPVASQPCDSASPPILLYDSPLLVATPVGTAGGLLVFSTFRYLNTPGADNAEILRQIILSL